MKKTLKIILYLFFIFIGSWAFKSAKVSHAYDYSIESTHPRLLFHQSDIATIKTKVQTDGEFNKNYQYLKTYADEWRACNGYELLCARIYSVLYRIGEVSGFSYTTHSIDDYGTRAIEFAKNYTNYSGWLYRPTYIELRAIAFDLLYDKLTAQEKQDFANQIFAVADSIYTESISNYNGYGVLSTTHGIVWENALYQAGAVLYNEGYDNNKAQNYIDESIRWVTEQYNPMLKKLAGNNGGFILSMTGYGAGNTLLHMIDLYEDMYKSNNGTIDLFTDNQYLKKYTQFILDTRRMEVESYAGSRLGGSTQVSIGDSNAAGLYPQSHWRGLLILENRMSDGLARYLIETAFDANSSLGDQSAQLDYILNFNPSVTKVLPKTLPTSTHHDGSDWITMRSGWTANDILATFRASDYLHSHQHLDQNSFTIDRGPSRLAIDSGVYEGSQGYNNALHWDNYYTRTVAHNSMTVYDPDETFIGQNGIIANDGGQLYQFKKNGNWGWPMKYEDYTAGSTYDIADIKKYEATDSYTYAVGDATRAYNPSKLTEFIREFVFIKPNFFIVFDRVNSTDANFSKKYLLHTVNEPIIIEDTFTVEHNGSRLFSKNILPNSANIAKVGGTGQEFSVNGTNYPYTGDVGDGEVAGAWRVEISPSSASQFDNFLNVMEVTDSSQTDMFVSILIESNDGRMVGVKINNFAVLFSKTDQNNQTITYHLDGDGVVNQLVANLKPSTTYTIKIDGNVLKTVQSSNQGTIFFEVALGSSHEITLVPEGVSLSKSVDKSSAQRDNILTYTISYAASKEVTNAKIEDPIPIGTTYVANSATNNGTFDGTKLIWNLGNLAPGANGSVSFQVRIE